MRRFKTPDRNQLMLFPPNLNDWIGEKHLARYVVQVVDSLDLSSFYAAYGETGVGQPPYDPKMMVSILLYANVLSITSSRKIERLLTDDVGFRFICAHMTPDHDTIAEFRHHHAERLEEVFVACVRLSVKAGVVGLNNVSIDGTKMRANAAKSARKTEQELNQEIQYIEKIVGNYFDECDQTDAQEDEKFGKGKNGYFLPDFLADPETRQKWIEEQLKEMEAEDKNEPPSAKPEGKDEPPTAKPDTSRPPKKKSKLQKQLEKQRRAKAALHEKEKQRKEADPTGKRERDSARKRGTPYVAKINVTDPECRTMLFSDGKYGEGYNCQIAVDNEAGIIVAADITQDANDVCQLGPMTKDVQANTGWLPDNITADNGYLNFDQIEDPKLKSVEFYIPPKKAGKNEKHDSKSERMREKLETERGKAIYGIRKGLVEPVFGAIKQARKFRQVLTRGKKMVKAEWLLMCTAHNLLKLYKLGVAVS